MEFEDNLSRISKKPSSVAVSKCTIKSVEDPDINVGFENFTGQVKNSQWGKFFSIWRESHQLLLISEWDEHICSKQELAERFVNEWKIMGMRKIEHKPIDGVFNPEDCLDIFENHLEVGHQNTHARNLF